MYYSDTYLPHPLTNEETDELLKQIDKTYARSKLIECNLRLVIFFARRYEGNGFYIEDLISIGTIGLIKAINNYDGHEGLFANYLGKYICEEIELYIDKQKKYL